MKQAIIDSGEAHDSVILNAEILRKTYEVMFSIGLIELALRLAFF